ncbi:MAG: esterase/lipase family protein [Gammaproteobacteria bacterium]
MDGIKVTDPDQDALGIVGDFSNFDQLGLEVRAAVRGILNRHPSAEIVLLGHSRGGLAARDFLQKTSPERDKVVGLVTTGTPHLGTRLGRIYQYLKNHPCNPRSNCSTNPVLTEDWHVVDFLRNLPPPDSLDVRRPTIGDLDDRSLPDTGRVTVGSLNTSIGQLPTGIKYGELLYTGVDLGWLKATVCYIFGDPSPLDLCPDVSAVLQGYLLLPKGIPSAFPGDGIVPLSSQRYLAIPGFPAAATKRYARYGKANTVHTDEPKQEMDIDAILTQMMGTWWTTR